MFCPICQRDLAKKFWSNRQWQDQSWLAEGIVGCKDCRLQPGQTIQSIQSVELPAVLKDWVVALASSVTREARRCTPQLAQHWNSFVDEFISKVERQERKRLSWLGAVRTQHPWEPTHFTTNVGPTYDPSNWIYDCALDILFPGSWSMQHLNEETKGDIAECVLAQCERHGGVNWLQAPSVGRMIHETSAGLYGLSRLLNLETTYGLRWAVSRWSVPGEGAPWSPEQAFGPRVQPLGQQVPPGYNEEDVWNRPGGGSASSQTRPLQVPQVLPGYDFDDPWNRPGSDSEPSQTRPVQVPQVPLGHDFDDAWNCPGSDSEPSQTRPVQVPQVLPGYDQENVWNRPGGGSAFSQTRPLQVPQVPPAQAPHHVWNPPISYSASLQTRPVHVPQVLPGNDSDDVWNRPGGDLASSQMRPVQAPWGPPAHDQTNPVPPGLPPATRLWNGDNGVVRRWGRRRPPPHSPDIPDAWNAWNAP
jgi:hypothetical protein